MADVPIEEIADCTCLRLRRAARRATQIYDRCLEPAGLTVTQFGVLAHLHARARSAIGELAEALVMDPTTLTRNLRPLESRGYVRIEADPSDRRRRRIVLTKRGRSALRDAVPLWRTAQRRTAAALGDRRADTLRRALDHAIDRLATR